MSSRSVRKGRPPSKRPEIDHGTPEAQRKRARLAPRDPGLAEYPLGILLARDRITQDQHNAGLRYAALYAKALGRSSLLGLDHGTGAPLDDESLKRIEMQFRDCKNRLLSAGRRIADAVDNCAVYRRLPRWAESTRPRPSDWPERHALIDGLDILVALLIGRANKERDRG
jgi:hypothetical protein